MRILAIIASLVGYFVLLMGSLVTTTGSGQGCGNSWPFCHGQIIPGTITVAGVIEYSHRVVSSVDGLLVLVLAIGAWLLYNDFRARLFGILSLFFVVLQGALGALTVVYEGTFVKTWLLSVHFGLSLIAFASALLLTIRLFQIDRGQRDGAGWSEGNRRMSVERLQYPIWGLAIYTYIVVYTGALVEHAGALMGCGYEVPGCGSTYFPNLTSTAGIQVLHRYAASSLWILVLALLIVVTRRYSEQRDIVRGSWWAFILITLQAISGAAQVLTGGQMIAILSHTTIISVFFAVLCYLCMQVGWPWRRKQTQQNENERQLEPAASAREPAL
jgi:cytochrome c oxidase assembly protein subunit 15